MIGASMMQCRRCDAGWRGKRRASVCADSRDPSALQRSALDVTQQRPGARGGQTQSGPARNRRSLGFIENRRRRTASRDSVSKWCWTAAVLWSAVLLLVSPRPVLAQAVQDVLYLQDGRERVGRLVEIDDARVLFNVKGQDAPQAFNLVDVQRIELASQRVGDEIARLEDLDDPLLSRLVANAPGKLFYSDSGYITLYRFIERHLHDDGSYTQTERIVRKVFRERGESLGSVARYFKKGEETLEVDFARTVNPDGSVIPITEAALEVSSVNGDTPEYDKQQQLKFAMKRVSENSILDYQITKRRSQTDLLNPFVMSMYFKSTEPILESELRIIVPRDRKVAVAEPHADYIEGTTEEVDGETIYSFKCEYSPRIVPEPFMPPWPDFAPLVVVAEQSSWENIGEAYRSVLLAGSTPSPALARKVAELVNGAADIEEKARRVYRYFAKNIRQIWVGPDEYSYAPRPVSEVFDKHAGNTTDKAALLRAMMVEAGVPAAVVLAAPRGGGKLIEEVPCIKQLDDAVVAVSLPTGRVFLALDDEDARFGQVPSEYQGTRGLWVSASEIKLIDIPLNAPREEQVAYTYEMTVEPSGDLTVVANEAPTGNYEMGYRAAYKGMKDEELRRMFEASLTNMHPIARLDHYAINNVDDLSKPMTVTQSYTLLDYALGNENLLVFRLPVLDYDASSVGKPDRVFPMAWGQVSRSVTDVTLSYPSGYRVYHAGRDYHAESEPATFDAHFQTTDDGKIHYRDEFVQRRVEAPKEAYKGYKACLETMARVPKEWIVLEKVE